MDNVGEIHPDVKNLIKASLKPRVSMVYILEKIPYIANHITLHTVAIL